MKNNAKFVPPNNAARQAEAEKTSRLRALRLAKEAADKQSAALEAAAHPGKSPRRRSRAAQLPNPPELA